MPTSNLQFHVIIFESMFDDEQYVQVVKFLSQHQPMGNRNNNKHLEVYYLYKI